MSDTIIRWECPKCKEWNYVPMPNHPCPGVPVERTYVLKGTERDANEVDALRDQRDEARAEVERLRGALRLVIERDEAATDFDGRHNLGIAARVAREELGEQP